MAFAAVYVSGDLGVTWKLSGHPASAGDAGVLTASAPGHLVIATATASAESWLYYSADNGKTVRRRAQAAPRTRDR